MPAVWKGWLSINLQNPPRPRLLYYWAPVVGYGILIFYLSSLQIRIEQPPFAYHDKVFHSVEYGVFVWLWYRALRASWNIHRLAWIRVAALMITLAFAAFDEMYQSRNPSRSSDLYDFLADAIGAFSVMWLTLLWPRR
jgi:hypothetical protein